MTGFALPQEGVRYEHELRGWQQSPLPPNRPQQLQAYSTWYCCPAFTCTCMKGFRFFRVPSACAFKI